MSVEHIKKFIDIFTKSLTDQTFVKMTLGNYTGDDPHLQKLLIRLLSTKKGIRLFFLYRYDTRDTAKNYTFDKGVEIIRISIAKEFLSGHLFTTERDFHLDIGKNLRTRLNTAKPTFHSKPEIEHNRRKQRPVNQDSFYLKALKITTDEGRIRDKQQGKWKQINKFVETISILIENSPLKNKTRLKIVDMGAGKGYLTFAAYDYFKNTREKDVSVIGLDTRRDLVDLGNDIAKSCGFDGLEFAFGHIDDFELVNVDVLIALHACNTATDDAIYKGIRAGAELIVAAPCCHQEIRPQIIPPEMLRNVLKHGIMLEHEAETITDGLRALLLEKSGYSTKVFEFISNEHTAKNNMIVGTRLPNPFDTQEIDKQIRSIKDFYGIQTQRLETLLDSI